MINTLLGYRYELYCASKSARTTQCTVFCAISKDVAWTFNEKRTAPDVLQAENKSNSETDTENDQIGNGLVPYTKDIFDALILRYEEPIANNRWDAPLFTVVPEMKLNLENVYSALYEKKPPPPNQATQNVSVNLVLLLLNFLEGTKYVCIQRQSKIEVYEICINKTTNFISKQNNLFQL